MSSSTSIPRGDGREIGEYFEHTLADHLSIELVDDSEADWYDARAPYTMSVGLVDLSDTICIPQGTKIEIKAARYRVSNGADGSRRGRIYIKHDSHERLLEAGRVYCIVVYDSESILAVAWIRATTIDAEISNWCEIDGRCHGDVGKVSWAKLIPPDIVNGGPRR